MTTEEPEEAQWQRVLEGLVAFTSAQSELGRLFARSRQMHTTDATAIVQILEAENRGEPLTPARLAERIALTTGATSILLNRLEAAGHILRTRGHADRRRVTLHSTPSIHEAADAHYEPLNRKLNEALSTYSPDDLALVRAVVEHLRSTMTEHMDALGAPSPAPPSAPPAEQIRSLDR